VNRAISNDWVTFKVILQKMTVLQTLVYQWSNSPKLLNKIFD